MSAVHGSVERRNVSILMLDSTGATEVVRWDLTNAWPLDGAERRWTRSTRRSPSRH